MPCKQLLIRKINVTSAIIFQLLTRQKLKSAQKIQLVTKKLTNNKLTEIQ